MIQDFKEFISGLGPTRHFAVWNGIKNVYVLKEKNTAIEFVTELAQIGGKPIQRMEALSRHYDELCQTRGLAIFRLYAADWDLRPAAVQHWLLHKLGQSQRLCHARETEPVVLKGRQDPGRVRSFYEDYHLQGFTTGFHYGLQLEGKLVACMTLSEYIPERQGVLKDKTFNLSRFALAGHIPGGASRLFKFARKACEARKVVTYSDNIYAVGGIYGRLGFVYDGDAKPEYRVWHPHYGLKHKSFWARRKLPARLRELQVEDSFDPDPTIDPRTEFEMCRALGCLHAWDLGKKRWVWEEAKT